MEVFEKGKNYFKEISCPTCGKSIRLEDLPEPSEFMSKVAVHHGDHVVLVKYDRFDYIRAVEPVPFKVLKESDSVVNVESCPICGSEVRVVREPIYPAEYAYNHGDHVVIVNLLEDDLYFIEAYPLIEVSMAMRESPFIRILNQLGPDGLAMLIAKILMVKKGDLIVPRGTVEPVKEILKELDYVEINVREGDFKEIDESYYRFFGKIIRIHAKNSMKLEEKIKSAILLIEKVEKLLKASIEKGGKNKGLKEFLKKLEKKGILELVKYRLELEQPFKIVTPKHN